MKNKNRTKNFKRSYTTSVPLGFKGKSNPRNHQLTIQFQKEDSKKLKTENNKPIIITNKKNQTVKNIIQINPNDNQNNKNSPNKNNQNLQNFITQNSNNSIQTNNNSNLNLSPKKSYITDETKERNKNVKVYCRFRPLNEMELSLLKNNIGYITPEYQNDNIVTIKTKKTNNNNNNAFNINLNSPNIENGPSFKFDKVFQEKTPQIEIYENIGKDIVKDIMEGYNGTIFAYGQSGSGKTFTMYGNDINDENIKGVIPRIIQDIFSYVETSDENISFQFKLSFVQIYKEVIYDLLTGEKNLHIKESPTRGIFIDNLSEVYLSSIDDFIYYTEIAESNRKVGETKLNQQSSRSHSIMILEVLQQFKKENIIKKGILNLVDLAGSEKVSKTGAVGETLEEAKKINLSLSALGNVIHALTSNSDHIPYRDSKLTRILQESLGGNFKTSLIVTCSPHSYNLDESISSLQFAQRAKTIKNKVKVNIKYSYEELQQMVYKLNKKLEIANQKILRLKKGEKDNDDNYNHTYGNYTSEIGECINCAVMREEKNILENKIEELNNEIKEKNEEIEKLKNRNSNNSFSSFSEGDNYDKKHSIKNLYYKIKNILEGIQEENLKINNNGNIISNNLIIQNDNFNELISNYINNSDKQNFFDEINKMILKNLKNPNETYNNIYDEYIKNLNDIFSKIENNNNIPPEDLLKQFSTNFFYEYLHYYFSYQLLNQVFEKIKNDNESLNNINSQLTLLLGDLLSSNYEMANNNVINENAINFLKNFEENTINDNIKKTNTINQIPNEENIKLPTRRMSVTFGNDISQKFIKVVSKKSMSLRGKPNRKCSAIVTLKDPIYFNSSNNQYNKSLFNNNNNYYSSIESLNNKEEVKIVENVNEDNLMNYNNIQFLNNNNTQTIFSEEIISSDNRRILNETKIGQSQLKMIKQIFISNAKKNEDFIQEIENVKKNFNNIINYNNNYFSNLILDSNKKNANYNLLIGPNLIVEEKENDENSPREKSKNNINQMMNINNNFEDNDFIQNNNNINKEIKENNKNKNEKNVVKDSNINKKNKDMNENDGNINNNNNEIKKNNNMNENNEINENNNSIKTDNFRKKEEEMLLSKLKNSEKKKMYILNTEESYDQNSEMKNNNQNNIFDFDISPKNVILPNKNALNKVKNPFKNQITLRKKYNNNIKDGNTFSNIKNNNNISTQSNSSAYTILGDKLHSKYYSNLFLIENKNLQIFPKKNNKYNNQIKPLLKRKLDFEDESFNLEKSIEKYLQTGTASRRFDGVKVKYNNGSLTCEYATGLNANQFFDQTPLSNQKIKESLGDEEPPNI